MSSLRNHAMLIGMEMGIWFAGSFILSAQQINHPGLAILGLFVDVYIVFCIVRAGQHYKYTECNGKITFGLAYRYIIWLFVFSSLVASLIRFIYLQWIDTSYLSAYYDIFENQMRTLSPEFTSGDGATALSLFRESLTPIRFSIYYIFSDVLTGAILGLLIAPFISRRDSNFFKDISKNDENIE